jgi:protein TonB
VLIGKPLRPPYPPKARRAGIRGTEIVEVIVDREGCARQPRILRGLPMGMDSVALAAVQSWTFQPAMLEGRPVAAHFVVTVPFSLKDP